MSEELKHYTNEWDDWDNTKTPFGELQEIATKLKLENDVLRKQLEVAKFKLRRISWHSYDVDESAESIATEALAEIEQTEKKGQLNDKE